MSLTLGEKLRAAREERGVSISEVAEQTRISPLYIESIENDDYRNLPGGIFNKGFVKSFAKYVGVNEQEALMDYAQLISAKEGEKADEVRTYRPEVLTDDRSHNSSVPTVVVAVIILALMTAGVLFLVNYLRRPTEPVASMASNKTSANENVLPAETPIPRVAAIGTVEFRSVNKMTLLATIDGGAVQKTDIAAGSSAKFDPQQSLTLNYLRWNAPSVQLTLDGKQIALPSAPVNPADKDRIIFTISKDNLDQILSSGSVTGTPSASPTSNTNTAIPSQQRPTPLPPKPAAAAANGANTAPKPVPTPNPPIDRTVRPKPTP